MKKSKLSITLVTSFIAAMALTACNEVTKSDDAIVSFKTYSGETVNIITNDMYKTYRNTSDGINKFYNKILEFLIRYEFDPKQGNFKDGEMNYDEIEVWAKNQVQEQKDKAKANAKSNKTSYDDEWDSILESYNVEDEEELKQHFIYDKEKEVITNWYADSTEKAEKLKNEFIGVTEAGAKVESKVASAMPYHIRHILVKVDEAADAQAKFYKGTITEAQAKLLYDTVSTLASGKYTFSEIAKRYSEDGSASSGGDVGIMTNAATSGSLGMVNEFQLGLYAYDNIYTDRTTDPAASVIKEGLGLKEEVVNDLPAEAVTIPYDAFAKIGEYAKVTADKQGNKLGKGSATLYPRNILWNKYLNLHNVFLIKNVARDETQYFGLANANEEFSHLSTAALDANAPAAKAATVKACGFNANGILEDENHNPIIGVRSQYGIHFMVIEKSMYEYAGSDNNSKLSDYYSTKILGETGFNEDSYVGYIVSQSAEDYKKRADDVKSKITSFDPTYDYRLYNELLEGKVIDWNDNTDLKDKIDAYISKSQSNNLYKQEDGLRKVWRTYNELLDVQDANRDAIFDIVNTEGDQQQYLTRLVSEQAANDFMKIYNGNGNAADYAKFAEGGEYYYYA